MNNIISLFRSDIKKYNFRNRNNSCYMASTLQIFHRLNIDYNDMLIKNKNKNENLKKLINILRPTNLTIKHEVLSTSNTCRKLLDEEILKLQSGSQQDSSELFIQLINLFNNYQTDRKYNNSFQIEISLDTKLFHPYLNQSIIDTYNIQFDNGYFSKNVKFYILNKYKCTNCKDISYNTDIAYFLDIDKYELEMIMTGNAKTILKKECSICKYNTNHYQYKSFLTIPNLLILNSKRTYSSGNVDILNTPKLKKNINILLPIIDSANNIVRYTTIQYTLKMINVGPSQQKINLRKKFIDEINISIKKKPHKNYEELIKEILIQLNPIDVNKESKNNIKVILDEEIQNLIEKYPQISEEDLYKILLDNRIIIPNNIITSLHNSGHYTCLIRDELNSNNTDENLNWTLYDDIESNYIENIKLEYDSYYYDNIRIYIYERVL
jgi:hypothetical protein